MTVNCPPKTAGWHDGYGAVKRSVKLWLCSVILIKAGFWLHDSVGIRFKPDYFLTINIMYLPPSSCRNNCYITLFVSTTHRKIQTCVPGQTPGILIIVSWWKVIFLQVNPTVERPVDRMGRRVSRDFKIEDDLYVATGCYLATPPLLL